MQVTKAAAQEQGVTAIGWSPCWRSRFSLGLFEVALMFSPLFPRQTERSRAEAGRRDNSAEKPLDRFAPCRERSGLILPTRCPRNAQHRLLGGVAKFSRRAQPKTRDGPHRQTVRHARSRRHHGGPCGCGAPPRRARPPKWEDFKVGGLVSTPSWPDY